MTKPSTYVWCELVCAQCNGVAPGRYVSNGRLPIASMRKEAEGLGWVFFGKDAFCSTRCVERFNDQSQKRDEPSQGGGA